MTPKRRVAITGAFGFLGWHTACRLRAVHGIEPIRLGRADLENHESLVAHLADVDAVLHVAGVNRAGSDAEVEEGNVRAARQLAAAISETESSVDVVFANSIQAEMDNPYGRGKAKAADILRVATESAGGSFADLLLPNLFGEHGRPAYNSFVATFAQDVARGREPDIFGDREIQLLHAQDAADVLIRAIGSDVCTAVRGELVGIGQVLAVLREFHALYSVRGEIPELGSPLRRNLFNTYRAARFPDMWPIRANVHSDSRGSLYETVRAHGGTGMAFMSTTLPGQKRGDHYHIHKVERFFVVKGRAEIRLRRLFTPEVVTFRVGAQEPSFIDMPTLWVHDITNIGGSELVTMFWADQLLDPENPDQYPETVELKDGT